MWEEFRITLLRLLGMLYTWVLERGVHPLVEPQMQEEHIPSLMRNPWPALYSLKDISGCLGVCPKSLRVFCGLGEGIKWILLRIGRYFESMNVWPIATSHLVPVQIFQGEIFLVQIGLISQTHFCGCWSPAGLPFVTDSVQNLYGQNLLGRAKWWKASTLVAFGFRLCFLQMM